MTSAVLKRLYSLTHGVVVRNVVDVTDEQSMHCPEPGGNCLNWVVGHIVASRGGILKTLGAEPVWTSEDSAPYVRGSAALRDPSKARRFASILADLDESQSRILRALDTTSEGALAAKPAADRPAFNATSVGELLAFAHFHESYHAGQTGLLRRLLGKAGAIP
jgi:uncharacterized damage-inducible protein DinB